MKEDGGWKRMEDGWRFLLVIRAIFDGRGPRKEPKTNMAKKKRTGQQKEFIKDIE